MQAMINLYESYHEALHAVQELEAASIPSAGISMITLNGKRHKMDAIEEVTREAKKSASKEPVLATVPEAVDLAPHLKAVFFSALDLRTMDGIGDVIAAGWLIDREDGSVSRRKPSHTDIETVIGIMVDTGVSQENAETYIEGIRRGGTLIGVKTDENLSATASRILREEHRPLDPHMRGHHYWQGDVKSDQEKLTSAANRLLAALITGQT